MNTLVFDIETVPDVALGRRACGLEGLADAEVAKAMFTRRRQQTGSDFLPHEQHRVVAISCALRPSMRWRPSMNTTAPSLSSAMLGELGG